MPVVKRSLRAIVTKLQLGQKWWAKVNSSNQDLSHKPMSSWFREVDSNTRERGHAILAAFESVMSGGHQILNEATAGDMDGGEPHHAVFSLGEFCAEFSCIKCDRAGSVESTCYACAASICCECSVGCTNCKTHGNHLSYRCSRQNSKDGIITPPDCSLSGDFLAKKNAVTLHSLVSRPDLNGQRGRIVRELDGAGRWGVEVSDFSTSSVTLSSTD
jgi:hypothetical protein